MTQTVDPFDELAALFLTEADEQRTVDRDGHCTTVELVVVGHLPVRAGLWLTPYADARAREGGPTALLRLDSDEPSIQILQPPEAMVKMSASPAGYATIRDAVGVLARAGVGMWVIRPASEVAPSELLEAGADRITILSSADEAAIVGAYQRLKDLVEAAQQSGVAMPSLGLAVPGADRQAAERMRQRLNRTTSTFLEIQLPLVACVQRMDAAIRAEDFPRLADEPAPSLASVLGWIRAASLSEQPLAASRASTIEPDLGGSHPWPSSVKIAPKLSVEVEPKDPDSPTEPDAHGAPITLAKYVPGLTPLPVRCPGHERLELGVDSAGRLHVLAREAQLRDLYAVEAWTNAHRELIARACADHWIDTTAIPVRHVFTDEPASLADLHGCDLRLHVLAPVTVAGRRGWYAAPLNALVR